MFVKLSLVGAINYIIINCNSKNKFSFMAVVYNLGVALGTITPVLSGIQIYHLPMQYNLYLITVTLGLIASVSFYVLNNKST